MSFVIAKRTEICWISGCLCRMG